MILPEKHIFLTTSSDIDQICSPLNKLGIYSFDFIRIYKDNSRINLSNIPNWMIHSYKREYYKIGKFEGDISSFESGCILWNTIDNQEIFNDARENFNISNGVTIIEKHDKFCDFYYFGAKKENIKIVNFYINNLIALKTFILYFKEKAIDIIKQADKKKIFLFSNEDVKNENRENFDSTVLKDFLNVVKINEFYMQDTHGSEVKLTKREFHCLAYTMLGKSAKEISTSLFISPRTVETHVESIKEKIGLHTKSALRNHFFENLTSFIQYIK